MREILPNLSCQCSEAEFQNGDADGYQAVYIVGKDGKRWKNVKLEGGGHFTFEVKSIPGEELDATKSELSQELHFLPDGKIPRILLQQIIKFFRQVMAELGASGNRTHGALEAMAHILWTPERGYFVGIPEQTVSAASVTYNFDYIPSGAMIVVDIHSHNNMDAFFSGTDNRDDERGVWISGVAGKLSDKECKLIWRFNYEKVKVELKVDDIFESEENNVEIPEEWLAQVKKQTFQRPAYNSHLKTNLPQRVVPGKKPIAPGPGDTPRPPVQQTIMGGVSMYLDSLGRRVVPRGMGNNWDFYDSPSPYRDMFGDLSSGFDDDIYYSGYPGWLFQEGDDTADDIIEGEYMDADQIDDVSLKNLQQDLAEAAMRENGNFSDEEEDDEDDVHDPAEQALIWMEEISALGPGPERDRAFLDIITEAYVNLSEKAKAKIADQGL